MMFATGKYHINIYLYAYAHNKHRVFADGSERNTLRKGYVCAARLCIEYNMRSGCDDDIETLPYTVCIWYIRSTLCNA